MIVPETAGHPPEPRRIAAGRRSRRQDERASANAAPLPSGPVAPRLHPTCLGRGPVPVSGWAEKPTSVRAVDVLSDVCGLGPDPRGRRSVGHEVYDECERSEERYQDQVETERANASANQKTANDSKSAETTTLESARHSGPWVRSR